MRWSDAVVTEEEITITAQLPTLQQPIIEGDQAVPSRASANAMQAVLNVVIPRTVGVFRAMWAVAATLMVSTFALLGDGAPFAVPAAAVSTGWAVTVVVICWRQRRLPRWLALVDVAIFALLLVSARWTLPPPLVGDGSSWIFVGATVAALLAAWTLSWQMTTGLGAGLIVAYFGGVALDRRVTWSEHHVQTAFLLALQAALGVLIVRTIRNAARRADRALDERVATEAAHHLERDREDERHSQELVLHDEIRRALWLLGNAFIDVPSDARRLCREALRHLEGLAQGRLAPPRAGTLVNRIEQAVDEFRALGLSINVRWLPIVERRRAVSSDRQRPGRIPSPVVDALEGVLRETLANTRRHAKTTTVNVDVRYGPSRLSIVVTDDGVGISTGAIPQVREAFRQRLMSIGGTADVRRLAPQGTQVRTEWAGAEVIETAPDIARAPLRAYGGGFARMLAVIAGVFHAMALYHLLHLPFDYKSPTVAFVCWVLMLAAGVTLGLGIGRSWMTPFRARFAVAVVAVAAVVVAADCHWWGVLGPANWAAGDAGWIIALLAAHRPIREAVVALAVVGAGNVAIILPHVAGDPARLTKLMGILLGVALVQVGAAIAFSFVRKTASETADNVWQASRLVTAQQQHDEARAARSLRYAQVDQGIVELLRSIADERLDPNAPEVQRRCLAASRSLRRRDLAPLADAAARVDVDFNINSVDDLSSIPQQVRQRMIGVLITALAYARSGPALLTSHDGIDLATAGTAAPATSRSENAPTTVTLRFPLASGQGPPLRSALSRRIDDDPGNIAINLELSDDNDADIGSEAATVAWIAVAYRP